LDQIDKGTYVGTETIDFSGIYYHGASFPCCKCEGPL
jgi:hypothetical protein